jgi:hypothetical protein
MGRGVGIAGAHVKFSEDEFGKLAELSDIMNDISQYAL